MFGDIAGNILLLHEGAVLIDVTCPHESSGKRAPDTNCCTFLKLLTYWNDILKHL